MPARPRLTRAAHLAPTIPVDVPFVIWSWRSFPFVVKGRQPATPADRSGMRYPRVAARHRHFRAASGIMLAGITTGAWGAATGLGQRIADNARANHVPGSLA